MEGLLLGRECIKADLKCRESQRHKYVNGIYSSLDFQSTESEPFWETAYTKSEWQDAKRTISTAVGPGDLTPDLVLTSTLSVVAERFFERYIEQLDELKDRCYPRTAESDEASRVRSKYMELLTDLSNNTMNIGLFWLKYVTSIMEWDKAVASEEVAHLRTLLNAAEESRDRALGVYKEYISVGTSTDLLQYDSVGTSMDQHIFFSAGTGMGAPQYQSTGMCTETVTEVVDCVHGRATILHWPSIPKADKNSFNIDSSAMVEEPVVEKAVVHLDAQMSTYKRLDTRAGLNNSLTGADF